MYKVVPMFFFAQETYSLYHHEHSICERNVAKKQDMNNALLFFSHTFSILL